MKLPQSYDHLTKHIVPGPRSLTYFIPFVLLPLAMLIPRSVLSRWTNISIFMPSITVCIVHVWIEMMGVDVISADLLLWSLFLLVLKDPWRDFRRVRLRSGVAVAERSNGQMWENSDGIRTSNRSPTRDIPQRSLIEESYPADLASRLTWVGALLVSIRLEGWKTKHASHDNKTNNTPAHRFASRQHFIATTLASFTRGYLILDLASAYARSDPYFTDLDVSISDPLPSSHAPILRHIPPQLLRNLTCGAQVWALISQIFYFPCLLPVALNYAGLWVDEWSPHNIRPAFGPMHTAVSDGVRGFWSRYWHQMMRHIVSGPGYAVADGLGLRKGEVSRYAAIVCVAFGLSGCIHAGLVPPEPMNGHGMSAGGIRVRIAAFFWLQPVAMLIEVGAVRLMRVAASSSTSKRRLGLGCRQAIKSCWVLLWFNVCLPVLMEAFRHLNYWRMWPVPISLWKGLHGEGWVAW